jgi:hypothetical protein
MEFFKMSIDIIDFKYKYMEKVKETPSKAKLTINDIERKDSWAFKVFGDAEYAFMFDILIPNVEYALSYGYEYFNLD